MKKQTVRYLVAAGVAAVGIALGALLFSGALQLNHPTQPVRGVDVSHHQGAIDWPTLAGQDIDFAYVKATEGSAATDEAFEANWAGARAAGLRVGAYHFFSYDSPGAAQADHFIGTVPAEADALPPAIDVEFYGAYDRAPKPPAEVVGELADMVAALRARYGAAPVLYATRKAYDLYLTEGFEDCDIWIRSVISAPRLPKGRAWTLWQYSDRTRLKGYAGPERFIDMNVFSGTEAEFAAWPRRDAEG